MGEWEKFNPKKKKKTGWGCGEKIKFQKKKKKKLRSGLRKGKQKKNQPGMARG